MRSAKKVLEAVVDESGIWRGERAASHAFLLSPSVYRITEQQRDEFKQLGYALHDCLLGFSRVSVIAHDQTLNNGGVWRNIRRVISTGVPKNYQDLQGINPNHTPKLLKVDLMVDSDGMFKIAEIDGHNKRGLGYSTLALRFRESLYQGAKSLKGVVKNLSQEITKQETKKIKFLYADQERFYLPEFEIVEKEFAKHNISCCLMSESEATAEFLSGGLFMDLPFLYKRADLYDILTKAYQVGLAKFIIPPKPFFGSKGLLALIRNDGGNEDVENILRSFIKKDSLETVRNHIPKTYLVGKEGINRDIVEKLCAKRKFVLKEIISSGMKGIIFSDEREFAQILSKAVASNMNWILQEEVCNQPQRFSWYEKEDCLLESQDWFMRVTAHYVARDLADITITARRDRAVHGAKDCLQIGAIIL